MCVIPLHAHVVAEVRFAPSIGERATRSIFSRVLAVYQLVSILFNLLLFLIVCYFPDCNFLVSLLTLFQESEILSHVVSSFIPISWLYTAADLKQRPLQKEQHMYTTL